VPEHEEAGEEEGGEGDMMCDGVGGGVGPATRARDVDLFSEWWVGFVIITRG
jgi:hypothetical protein